MGTATAAGTARTTTAMERASAIRTVIATRAVST
ncbi:hypothetical protein FHR81_002769 [Actinoalloteichus hoggarensis]|nr:hypothetical protein [Actinoalloteichus hoggarensis]